MSEDRDWGGILLLGLAAVLGLLALGGVINATPDLVETIFDAVEQTAPLGPAELPLAAVAVLSAFAALIRRRLR